MTFARVSSVLPAHSGGLHCGGDYQGTALTATESAPAASGGLHCGPCVLRVGDELQVLPPLNGGFHCGRIMVHIFVAVLIVLPPLSGGLRLRLEEPDEPVARLFLYSRAQRRAPIAAMAGICTGRSS